MAASTQKHGASDIPPEAPDMTYKIHGDDLARLLSKYGIKDIKTYESLFTDLKKYEDPSVLKKMKDKSISDRNGTTKFKKRIVKALFYIPSKRKYKYLKIRLEKSSIEKAGIGAYAVDKIPKGAKAQYRGLAKNDDYSNPYYSWTVKSYDKKTGELDDDDEPQYYIDAYDVNQSNWTRYVNCGMKSKDNNFDTEQIYDKFYYVASRDINQGEELFIDYGEFYRKENLKMKGKY